MKQGANEPTQNWSYSHQQATIQYNLGHIAQFKIAYILIATGEM